MKKLYISIFSIIIIMIGLFIFIKFELNQENKTKQKKEAKNLTYSLESISTSKTENGNIIIITINNSSKNDGKISYISYSMKDKDGNIIEEDFQKYDLEFLAHHTYILQLKVKSVDFATVSIKPCYSDKSEIDFSAETIKSDYKLINNIKYDFNNDITPVTIVPDTDIYVNEFKIVIRNSINEEVYLEYQSVNKDIKANESYVINIDKRKSQFLSIDNIEVYYQ